MDVVLQRDPTAGGLNIEKSEAPVLTEDQELAVKRITETAESGGGALYCCTA